MLDDTDNIVGALKGLYDVEPMKMGQALLSLGPLDALKALEAFEGKYPKEAGALRGVQCFNLMGNVGDELAQIGHDMSGVPDKLVEGTAPIRMPNFLMPDESNEEYEDLALAADMFSLEPLMAIETVRLEQFGDHLEGIDGRVVYEKSNEGEMWVVDRDRTITIENDDAKQFVYPDLRSSLAEQPLSKLIERLTPDSADDLQNRLDDLFGDIQGGVTDHVPEPMTLELQPDEFDRKAGNLTGRKITVCPAPSSGALESDGTTRTLFSGRESAVKDGRVQDNAVRIDGARHMMIQLDQNGAIDDANGLAQAILGAPLSKLLGSELALYFPPPQDLTDLYTMSKLKGAAMKRNLTMTTDRGFNITADVTIQAFMHDDPKRFIAQITPHERIPWEDVVTGPVWALEYTGGPTEPAIVKGHNESADRYIMAGHRTNVPAGVNGRDLQLYMYRGSSEIKGALREIQCENARPQNFRSLTKEIKKAVSHRGDSEFGFDHEDLLFNTNNGPRLLPSDVFPLLSTEFLRSLSPEAMEEFEEKRMEVSNFSSPPGSASS